MSIARWHHSYYLALIAHTKILNPTRIDPASANSAKCQDLLWWKYGIGHTASYPHDNIRIQRLISMQGKSDLRTASKTIVRLQCISQTKT